MRSKETAVIADLPDGAKVAVNFVVALEQWIEPPRAKMALTADFPQEAVDMGLTDHASASWYAYGRRSGFPRLMRLSEELNINVSVAISAVIVEEDPQLGRDIADAGHELVAHGYSQDRRMFMMSAEEQRDEIRRCAEILGEASGVAPVGWTSQGAQQGDCTLQGLLENGFIWTNDIRDSDYPYVVAEKARRRLIAMPFDEINDAVLFRRNGQPPSAYLEMFRRAFDQLVAESSLGTGVVTPVLHSTYFGHPYGAAVLEECVDYARSSGVAWICTRKDVANAVLTSLDRNDKKKGKQ